MRLSWDEIRARAAEFARQWRGEGYERGQTQLFYQAFFEIFGVPVRRVASFERPVRQLGDKRGFIDLFWKGVLLVEQKSAGRDLQRAKTQALDYFPGLQDSELPRYLLLSDFQTFELWDLEEDDTITFNLADLPYHVERFGFIIGVQRRAFRDQDPVNIKASELIGQIYDSIKGWGHPSPDLERLLVRLVFCLFADNTGIFQPRDTFLDFLETRTAEDGTDVGSRFVHLCDVLSTPEDSRSAVLDEDLARFPYVDGDLFSDPMITPSFDSKTRSLLIQACHFDWSKISPAIFGSLFQSVMDRGERRAQGAHYTTEKNILKVIEPLFLDDLRAEFKRIRQRTGSGRVATLKAFHRRLGQMTFLDPACGCGNFLVIAYRELRSLEIDVIREIRAFSTIEEQQEMSFGGPLADRCRPVLRHRDRGLARAHRRDRPVDDGPHHEQPAELGVWRDVCAHPVEGVLGHRSRGRIGDGLARGPEPRALLLCTGESTVRRSQAAERATALAGAAHRRSRRQRRDAGLCLGLVHQGG